MTGALLGAQVRRVDAPWPDLLALTLSGRALRGVLLIGLAPAARGVGFCDERPQGGARTPFVLRAKSCLEGGRVVAAVRRKPASVLLVIERGGEQVSLEALLRGTRGNALLRDASGELLASVYPTSRAAAPADGHIEVELEALEELAELRAHGERLLAARAAAALDERKLALARGLRAAEKRLERRLAAIERDRSRVEQVNTLRRNAGLLLTHLHALGRDAGGQLELLDESVAPPARIAVDVDPLLGAQRQADAWFQSARKLERGAAIAQARALATGDEIARIRALAARAALAEHAEDLALLASEARALGAAVQSGAAVAPRARPEKQGRLPYRQFIGSGGRSILVGRGADDNDRLTLMHARPHDLWLHARDDAGSHVVVPLERNESCPSELLADAAMLAAHFSKARGEQRVDVIYVERRHVRKARKAPAGQVSVAREKVFRLALRPERLRALLASERKLPE